MEGKNSEEDIVEEYRKVYQELYKIEDDFTALEELREALGDGVQRDQQKRLTEGLKK